MATYDSYHTGEQIDEAVDIVLGNKSKGSTDTPVYLDANGAAQTVTKDANPTSGSTNIVESGGVFTQLSTKLPFTDVNTSGTITTSNTSVPSCGTVEAYVESIADTKQNVVTAGSGIVKDGNYLSLDLDNDFMTTGKLDNKWNHFSPSLEVGYGQDLVEEMKRAKKSSFDRSKFTVAGSPTITKDGVASGFSTSNYLRIGNVGYSNLTSGVAKYYIYNIKTPNTFSTQTIWGSGNTGWYFRFSSSGKAQLYKRLASAYSETEVLSSDTYYDFIIIMDYNLDKSEILYKKHSESTFTSATRSNWLSGMALQINSTFIGADPFYSLGVFTGSIDLKQFSITVDGVEVFNGNKTGIDTIKPVNFNLNTTMYAWVYDTHTIYANGYNTTTVAPTELYDNMGRIITQSASTWQIVVDGNNTYVKYKGNNATYTSGSNITTATADSPLVNPQLPIEAGAKITSDGVASGFGIRGSNGIDTKVYIPTDKDFEIELEFVVSGSDVTGMGQTHYILGTQYNSSVDRIPVSMHFMAGRSGSAVVWSVVVVDSNDTITTLTMSVTVGQRSAGDKIKTTLRRDKATGKYIATAIVNGKEKTPVSVDSTLDLVWSPRIYIGIQKTNYTVLKFFGSIDLNAFKIYVDGNLVYQPLLRIPYTQTVDGKKIVDSQYRSRVEDEEQQAGYTPYDVLETETKEQFTKVGNVQIVDGIASGFSSSNYLRTPSINFTKPWEITTNFDLNGVTGNSMLWAIQGGGWENYVFHNLSKIHIVERLSDDSVKYNLSIDYSFLSNTPYICKVLWTGTTYYLKLYDNNGNLINEKHYDSTLTLKQTSGYVQLGYGSAGNYSHAGSIDLKQFSITVDGKLAYQAITPPNYTLATVRNTAQQLLASTYSKDSTQFLRQHGACTADTAITLPTPYMDTNYFVSVPTSAKSTTGFTPTVTGDYIAEGYTSI